MDTAHATATNITIFPADDIKDVYLMHRGIMTLAQELVATIIEWHDCVEVRVNRKLDAAEHAAAMAFVGTLAGRDCTVINYEPNADTIAAAGGCQVAKAERPAVTPAAAPAVAAQVEAEAPAASHPRMILLPVDHACYCDDDHLCGACREAIDAADMAARDRSAAVAFDYYEGLADLVA